MKLPSLAVLRSVLIVASLFAASCDEQAKSKPSSLCSQPIPNSKQSLFEFRFNGQWATTSDPWGYAIHDAASQVSMADQRQLPKGRLFKVTADGVVHLASFAEYDPSVGEKTIRHVVRGVSIIETIFNTDGNGWWRGPDYTFAGVEAVGDRIAFTAVRDDRKKVVHDRVEVDAGGIVARTKNGVVQSLEVYRVEPNPAGSLAGKQHRFFYDTYTPAQPGALRVEQLPARGICK